MAYTRLNLSKDEIKEIVTLYHLGIRLSAIAQTYDISVAAVAYHVRPYKLVPISNDLKKLAKTILANDLQYAA